MKIFPIILSFLLLVSCFEKEKTYRESEARGIRRVLNTGKPSKPKMFFKKKLLYEINPEKIGLDLNVFSCLLKDLAQFDDYGNLYLADPEKCKIYKFDSTGKFVKSFGRKVKNYNPNYMLIHNDLIYIKFSSGKKYRCYTFTTDGKYKGRKKGKYEDSNYIAYCDDKMVYIDYYYNLDTGGIYKLIVNTAQGEEVLWKDSESIMNFCVGKNSIACAENVDGAYGFNAYNEYGNLKFISFLKGKGSVKEIFIDKYSNYWAVTNDKYNRCDVFDSRGIYLKKLGLKSLYYNPFIGDKYFEDSYDTFKVYDYEFSFRK